MHAFLNPKPCALLKVRVWIVRRREQLRKTLQIHRNFFSIKREKREGKKTDEEQRALV
ncbi:hypothetical protein GYMLUDRAFT_44607 [Collybiopsis luxurians FD-317 M1]|uniref:Uncharacterized protein n=1 Tax=Collybiopsis luxurians FD-317 M1 TaxID=944289 RepID=A0A0D0CL28_9AGAR|nr:hypothetical protein GYMLUDRAFT_44607 [Collybiopsis luxurians FD-317 M1]